MHAILIILDESRWQASEFAARSGHKSQRIAERAAFLEADPEKPTNSTELPQ